MSAISIRNRWVFWLTVLLINLRVHGAVDMFLECGDKIKGETQDPAFKNRGAIDVLAWSWGMSQSGSAHLGSGGGAGKSSFQDFSFVKRIDKATAPLMTHLASGSRIPQCKLTCLKAGEGRPKYLEITMTECIVTSQSTGGTGGEDQFTENLTLNFAKVKVEYFLLDEKGNPKSEGIFNWDIAGNREF